MPIHEVHIAREHKRQHTVLCVCKRSKTASFIKFLFLFFQTKFDYVLNTRLNKK